MERHLLLASALAFVLISAVTLLVNRHLPEPYMDEPFHVGQTQRYCAGRLLEWDPKITTFPGLYVAGVVLGRSVHALRTLLGLPEQELCGVRTLRWVNALAGAACVPIFYKLGAAIEPHRTRAQLLALTASCALFPVHFFFCSLYYTDVLSVLLTLGCHLVSLRRRHGAAAALGAAAVAVRQTNAVWLAFSAGVVALEQCQPGGSRRSRRASAAAAASGGAVAELHLLAARAWALRWTLLRRQAGVLGVLAAFAGFVAANGGVAVGDRVNHAPAAHLMQPLYLAAYAAAALAPALLKRSALRGAAAALRTPRGAAAAAAACVAAGAVAARFTIAHPFLLADNRHYAFYAWRRGPGATWWARYALAPAYVAGAAGLRAALPPPRRAAWALLFTGAAAAVLVPTPLVEPRYFTTPLLLLLLHAELPGATRLAALAAAYAAVDVAAAAVFVARPFDAAGGVVGRFMW